ncbi:hypothetical protein CYMTET_3365 [Cymbomonas tetramitiformis]|uniref:Uncharacterized protein n=1 Tax=Cymbomonas tetramitiformis TaxID=36881 RepID=A0AAE0LLG9_9CHLO|nr:hypothetical protein CYMTET_3365 [Cymbomonas tetramitiformis]
MRNRRVKGMQGRGDAGGDEAAPGRVQLGRSMEGAVRAQCGRRRAAHLQDSRCLLRCLGPMLCLVVPLPPLGKDGVATSTLTGNTLAQRWNGIMAVFHLRCGEVHP